MLTHCLQHISHIITQPTLGSSTLCKTPAVHRHKTCQFCCWQQIKVDNRLNTNCHSNESHPLQTSFTACTTCHMHALSSHNPQSTTDNVLYRTPEGTPIGPVHTHLVTNSGVQLVLINDKLHHFRMAIPSCPVQHGVSKVVSAVEQGLHLGCQVSNGADMATCCS